MKQVLDHYQVTNQLNRYLSTLSKDKETKSEIILQRLFTHFINQNIRQMNDKMNDIRYNKRKKEERFMRPSFSITNKMLNLIIEITQKVTRLEINQERNLHLRKENRIKSNLFNLH